MIDEVSSDFANAYASEIAKIIGQGVCVDIQYIPSRTCWRIVANTVIGNRDIKVEQWTDICQLEDINSNALSNLIKGHAGSIKRELKIARFSKGFKP